MFKWLRNLSPFKNSRREFGFPNGFSQYAGAQLSRFVDFYNALEVAHKERMKDLVRLRAHSRDLSKNNVYAARYLELVGTNLVGPEGINFESEILGNRSKPKDDWNEAIENAWDRWGQCCTVDGRLSWVEAQQLVASTVALDGEILIRMVRGYPNPCGFALELIDADRLDYQWYRPLQNGSRIVGGVELDAWGRRVAYWLWTAHPQDWDAAPQRIRVPATEILHLYREDRVQSVRGIPWITPAMVQINMLGRLWTAELVAANYDANRVGVIKPQQGIDANDVDDTGATAAEITSDFATFLGLDAGQDVIFPPSNHPNSVLPQFTSYLLKGVASGLGVAYHSLAGDLSESKFSSDRTALIQERDHWRKLQGWYIRSFCSPVYRTWLEMAILSGTIQLPVADVERLYAPRWSARSWEWVDPLKDVQASTNAISFGLSTYQSELASQGIDWREQFKQRAAEQELAKELGLVLEAQPKTTATVAESAPPGEGVTEGGTNAADQ